MKEDFDVPELGLDWMIPDKLAALACPDDYMLPALAALGIKVLISLNEYPPSTELVRQAGMRHVLMPFADGTAPGTSIIERFVAIVDDALDRDEPVAVHCAAGIGRTGTLLACYFVSHGMGAQDAIDLVRSKRPYSVENESQELAVLNWWRSLHGWRTARQR